MALIKCTECGLPISDKANICVHCGCPTEVNNVDEIEYITRIIDDDGLTYIKTTATLNISDWMLICDALECYSNHNKQRIKSMSVDEIKKLRGWDLVSCIEELDFLERRSFDKMKDADNLRAKLGKMIDY